LVRGGTNTVLTRRVAEVANPRVVEIALRTGGEALGKIKLFKIIYTDYTLWCGWSRASFARAMTRVADELTLVSAKRIRAIFKTRSIRRVKWSCFITGRTLVRGGTNTVFTRRVAEVANPRIVEIALRTVGEALGNIKLFKIIHTDYTLWCRWSRASFARAMTRVADKLIQVGVERIWAFFKARAIQRVKWPCFITGRTLVRGGTNTVFTRRVAEVANPRIVEIALRTGGEALGNIKLFKIIYTDYTLWCRWSRASFARAMTRAADKLIQVGVERIWAFFKARVIERVKWPCFITGRTLVRGGTNTVFTRRVAEVANPRIVEIALRTGGEALGNIKLFKIIHTDYTLWSRWSRASFARAMTRVADKLIQVCVERIWAFFKARAIQWVKWPCFITGRTLVRVRPRTCLASKVAWIAHSRIV
jgi:hypothetical protein